MMTRRKFLALGALAVPGAAAAHASLGSRHLRVRRVSLRENGVRLVHFTDFHYKGDAAYAERVIRTINELKPEFVCFTGDLVEEARFASEARAFIRRIEAPVFGSPGNHDYRAGAPFTMFYEAFATTRGAWLADRSLVLPQHDLEIVGMGAGGIHAFRPPAATRRLLLLHYPQMADTLDGAKFDLILAGHSHGGQVRLPFYGAPFLPWGVGPYDLGYFETKGGPLYVNPGIGTYQISWRFNCRPEVTLLTL